MNALFQLILSILPLHIDFPLDKIPSQFNEAIYICGHSYKIHVDDYEKRRSDIVSYLSSEINGWSYYFTIYPYVPNYIFTSDIMKIDYDYKNFHMYVSYGNKGDRVFIEKKLTSPFPMLLNNNDFEKIKNEIHKDRDVVSSEMFELLLNEFEQIKAAIHGNQANQ